MRNPTRSTGAWVSARRAD